MIDSDATLRSAPGYDGSEKFDQYMKVSSDQSLYVLPLALSRMSQAHSPSLEHNTRLHALELLDSNHNNCQLM